MAPLQHLIGLLSLQIFTFTPLHIKKFAFTLGGRLFPALVLGNKVSKQKGVVLWALVRVNHKVTHP
jgi:hypothetical protein